MSSSDAYSEVKSGTENFIPGSEYYIKEVEKVTVNSAKYISGKIEIISNSTEYVDENFNSLVGDEAIDNISKEAIFITIYGLDVVEKNVSSNQEIS